MGRRLSIAGAIAVSLTACALFTDLSGFEGTTPPDAGSTDDRGAGGGADTSTQGNDAGPGGEDATTEDVVDAGGPDACADANIASDPAHCGACNRTCMGGSCTFGKCAAVSIVTGLPAMTGLVVANGKIYVSVSTGIRRYDLDSTGGIDVASSPNAKYLAADATYLYFADGDDGKVKRWPLNGGGVEDMVVSSGGTGIAVSSSHVYFTHYQADGGVERVLLDGGGREVVFEQYNRPEDVDFASGELVVGGDGVNELAVFADAGPERSACSPWAAVPADGSLRRDDYFGEQQTGKIFRVPQSGGGSKRACQRCGQYRRHLVTGKAIFNNRQRHDHAPRALSCARVARNEASDPVVFLRLRALVPRLRQDEERRDAGGQHVRWRLRG
jgi:hypothetical protein